MIRSLVIYGEVVHIDEAIKKSVDLSSSKLKDMKIELDLENIEYFGLENELIQVFLNIFSNAVDAAKARKIKDPKLKISLKLFGEEILIRIKDNAGGIEDTIKDKIFEPYFTTKHKSQGTGIGLFMSTEMIKKHMNGTISVENEDFNGSIGAQFKITLPA